MEQRKSPFIPPTGYFDEVEDRVWTKLKKSNLPTRVLPWYANKDSWYAAAAVLVLFFGIVMTTQFSTSSTAVVTNESSVLTEYLLYNVEMDSYDWGEQLDQQSIENIQLNFTPGISFDEVQHRVNLEEMYPELH